MDRNITNEWCNILQYWSMYSYQHAFMTALFRNLVTIYLVLLLTTNYTCLCFIRTLADKKLLNLWCQITYIPFHCLLHLFRSIHSLEVQKVAKMIHVHIRSREKLTSSLTVPGKATLFPYSPSRLLKICSRSHPLTWNILPLTHACLISLPIPVTLTYYCNLVSFSWIHSKQCSAWILLGVRNTSR